jgi:hypothetical protein
LKNLPSSSFYDYIYQQLTLNNLSPDLFFAFLELFWPTFLLYNKSVFLKDNFSEEKYGKLENQDRKMTEYWMNLVTIEPFFEHVEDGSEKAEFLTKKLVEIWQIKLNQEFPHLKFIVEYLYDEDEGEYALTFYQKYVEA